MNFEKEILIQQQNELDESFIYEKLANLCYDEENKKILIKIGKDESKHYDIWKKITGKDLKPNHFKINWYILLARVFGLTFALRLMEWGEEQAQEFYDSITQKYPVAKKIKEDEMKHEQQLIGLLKDSRLNYAGSIVLGLNDALVELTGTLAWLTLAFANAKIIWATGLIMWIAASFSMAASWYLASKEWDNDHENPITSAIYTWVAYIVTVGFLIFPYFIFENVFVALAVMLAMAVIIIASYTFYISIAKQHRFLYRFLEMVAISLWVALISFGIWYAVKIIFWIEI